MIAGSYVEKIDKYKAYGLLNYDKHIWSYDSYKNTGVSMTTYDTLEECVEKNFLLFIEAPNMFPPKLMDNYE